MKLQRCVFTRVVEAVLHTEVLLFCCVGWMSDNINYNIGSKLSWSSASESEAEAADVEGCDEGDGTRSVLNTTYDLHVPFYWPTVHSPTL